MNIIILVCDALRAKNLHCYGYPNETSPNLDKIAEMGFLFTNSYSCNVCTDSSFTTITTGKHPMSHGILNHAASLTDEERSYTQNLRTLPEILKENGFTTIGIDDLGRWHNRGYDHYPLPNKYRLQNGSMRYHLNYGRFIRHMTDLINEISKNIPIHHYDLPVESQKIIYSIFKKTFRQNIGLVLKNSYSLTDIAIDLIKQYRGDDIFLFVHYWDNHIPYMGPRVFVNEMRKMYTYNKEPTRHVLNMFSGTKSEQIIKRASNFKVTRTIGEIIALYDASIRYVDYNIGRLYQYLEKKDLIDDTLLIITSDHGESLDEHQIYFDHHGLYDPEIHVPLIIHYPKLGAGKVYDDLVQHFDIVPTIFDILDIPNEDACDGNSLINLLKNNWKREYVFAEESYAQRKRMIRSKQFKYIQALNDKKCSICDRHHSKGDEFFNLQKDPEELNNIIDTDDTYKDMKQDLEDYIDGLKKPIKGGKVTFRDEREVEERLKALGYI